jgi:hypothetical protein
MLIVMESHATEEQIRAVCERVESLGLKAATTARVIARENSRADRTVVVSSDNPTPQEPAWVGSNKSR